MPLRILIVDDEPNIRRTLKLSLESSGHTVQEAGDASRALEQVDRQSFDMAFVDIRLGTDSGLELIEPILTRQPRLAVVLITAHAALESAIEAMRRGAVDYLPKPFTPAQVRAAIERVERIRGLSDRIALLEDQVRAEVPEVDLDSDDPQVVGCSTSLNAWRRPTP
ncbi:MAG: response regulator [Isosphaeraceae bacterium]